MIHECPECGKPMFHINITTLTGICSGCGYQLEIDEETWNLKYDDGYNILREILKYNGGGREHLIKMFELDKQNSYHAKYLLTPDVLEILKHEAPKIFNQLQNNRS